MWLSRRSLLIGLTALAGCGFEPVYGPQGGASGLRGLIQMDDPQDRNEFLLNEQLERRLGRASAPRYGLGINLVIRQEGLAISGSNEIERFNIIGSANFVLRDFASKERLLSDSVNTFIAYSASQQPVATRAAERDAMERLMIALADKIVTQLLLNADQIPQ